MLVIIILFLILLGTSVYFISHFAAIASMQKKQLMLLMRENRNLKNEFNTNPMTINNITIYYTMPKYAYGIVSNSCDLYIAPIKEYIVLCKLKPNKKLKILDCAKINNIIWYEVKFQSENNINNKGWIEAKNIIIFENNLNNLQMNE
ncbi:hypothetical protein OSC52_20025 [Clostridium pasteurianum]|uniref:hypothetical protein n=1 Tax=Clostridium pasteurianum TaxID=1501 RepID=UPI002260D543|nr:hypothetical protein [Clostridium pasteurianum]UZW14066.1 hypothetical protein OSC52_20025 [Clostridium pasteurianum]